MSRRSDSSGSGRVSRQERHDVWYRWYRLKIFRVVKTGGIESIRSGPHSDGPAQGAGNDPRGKKTGRRRHTNPVSNFPVEITSLRSVKE